MTGCGGGSDSADAPSTSDEGGTVSDPLAGYPKGPTREFIVPGGDNLVQTFGREATVAEREQASRVIKAWLRARAAEDWQADCSYLARASARELAEEAASVSKGKATTCPAALAFFGSAASGEDLSYNMVGSVVSLRVDKTYGYAQYHGRHDMDWVVPVFKENGKWMVAGAAPLDRLK